MIFVAFCFYYLNTQDQSYMTILFIRYKLNKNIQMSKYPSDCSNMISLGSLNAAYTPSKNAHKPWKATVEPATIDNEELIYLRWLSGNKDIILIVT